MSISNTEKSKFSTKDICAVIVSFNPTELLAKNVASLCNQVGQILIVDNGSEHTEVLDSISENQHLEKRCLGRNFGIAYALNKGLDYCEEKGYKLILTMDQDTILENDAVYQLLRVMNKGKFSSVGFNWDGRANKNQIVRYLITSGNLVSVDKAKEIGGFDNNLFIDSVDFDFSLRLIEAGEKLIKVAKAKGTHNLGERQEGSRQYTTHSAQRYYYIYRNHFYLRRKYFKSHPLFIIKKDLALVYDLIKIMIWDNERKEKLKLLFSCRREARKMFEE